MSIINCPNCHKRISSLAATCSHCGFVRGDASPEEMHEFERRKLRDRIYWLNMYSYVAMTIFVIGFGWYWWSSEGFQVVTGKGPMALIGLGAIAYLVLRVMLFAARRAQKAFRKG